MTPCSEDPAQSQKTAGRTLGQARCYYDRKRLNGQPCVREEQIGLHTDASFYFNLRILLLLLDVNMSSTA